MITIQNMGRFVMPGADGSARIYEVRINAKPICTFVHDRRKGLAECLKRAGEAVERHDHEEVERLLAMMEVT